MADVTALVESQKQLELHVEFWKILHIDTMDNIERFQQFLKVYRDSVWAPRQGAANVTKQTDVLAVDLKTFLDKAADTPRFTKHMYDLVEKIIFKGGADSATMAKELHANVNSLPKSVAQLSQPCRAFEAVEEMASRISAAKSRPRTEDLSEVLYDLHFAEYQCPTAVDTRATLKAAKGIAL